MKIVRHEARWVVPIDAPTVERGAVAIAAGRVAAVGPAGDLAREFPRSPVVDHGDAAIVPGLVNAHTHLELSWTADRALPRGDYVAWLDGLLEARRDAPDPAAARRAAADALALAIDRGTAAVGDIANDESAADILRASESIEGVLFLELLGVDPERADAILESGRRRAEAIASGPAWPRDRLRVELVPHAAHSVSPRLLGALAARACERTAPFSLHLAESADEVRLLLDGDGPLRELLDRRGLARGLVVPGVGPVAHADAHGALHATTLLVHGVRIVRDDLARLAARGVVVVTCPRSNRRLGVGAAPVEDLLNARVPVALGTDSLASNDDLDPFRELAALLETHPGLSPEAGLRCATIAGARALGLASRLGSIAPGKRARLLAIDVAPGPFPLERLRDGDPRPRWIATASLD